MSISCNAPAKLSLVGNLNENWEKFSQAFEIYLEALDLVKASEKRKIAIFLNLVGEEALEVYNTFTFATPELERTLVIVLAKFKDYCNPKKNILHMRFKFYNRNQQDGESFDTYLTDIRLLAQNCEFTDKDSMLRDRLVLGCKDQDSRNKLVKEGNPSLEEVIKSLRIADIQHDQLQQMSNSSNQDQVSSVKKQTFAKSENYRDREKCSKCGYFHAIDKCPALNKTCAKCQGRNHFANVCRSTKINLKSRRQIVHEANVDNNDQELNEEYYCTAITSNVNSVAWMQTLKIENVLDIDFKLDPGADVNIIPSHSFSTLQKMSSRKLNLQNSKITLESWNGYKTNVEGNIVLKFRFNNANYHETFYVAGNVNAVPILSRDTCVKLNLVKRVNHIKSEPTREYLVTEFSDLFEGIGKINKEYTIKLKTGCTPTSKPPHRVPLAIQPKLKQELHRLSKLGIISRLETPTEWVNRLVVVEKPNGTIRLCLDPQDLNHSILKDHYGIPTLSDVSSKLSHASVFSVLDLKDSFWHIPLDEKSSRYCTFSTMFGTYKFNRLAFGLSIASEVFQRWLDDIFGDIKGVCIYIDDLLCYGNTKSEMDEILTKVLERARESNIKFNLTKFQYNLTEVKYLGHVFKQGTICPDEDAVKAIVDYDVPSSQKDLQRFLGLVNYLGKFIPNLAENTSPLRDLLKKESIFNWQKTHEDFDSNKQIVIQTDASKNGIGCVLLQDGKPVYYASKALSTAEMNYGQIEKEFLAILYACKKFHHFIYGKHAIVHTDHLPLVSLMKKEIIKIPSTRLQRIKLKLGIYDLSVQYIPGSKMLIADALSRACSKANNDSTDSSLTDVVHSVNISHSILKTVEEATKLDPVAKYISHYFFEGWPKDKSKVNPHLKHYYNMSDSIVVENGLIFVSNRLFIPLALQDFIIKKVHESHMGINKTKARAKTLFYWYKMNEDIENFVITCHICKKFSRNNVKQPMNIRELPSLPFQIVAMDLMEYDSKTYLVLIDSYSKWLELVNINTKNAETIIDILKTIFATHGIPAKVYADNNPFNSLKFKNFASEYSFDLVFSSPHFHQSNGLAEKAVSIAKNILRRSKEAKIETRTLLAEYRNTAVMGTSYAPTQLLFSRLCRTKLPIKDETLEPKVIDKREFAKILVQKTLQNKFYYDRGARPQPHNYTVGQHVYYKDNEHTTIWNKAVVEKIDENPRSYWVRDVFSGRLKRRNTWFLKPLVQLSNVGSSRFWSGTTETTSAEMPEMPIQDETREDNQQSLPCRERKKPAYLNDYVLN